MNKKELLQQKLEEQKIILQKAKQENNRSLSQAEQEQFDLLQAEIEQLKREIEDEENQNNSNQNQQTRTAEEENKRVLEIMGMCREFNIDATEFIRDKRSVDEARKLVLEHLKQTKTPIKTGFTSESTNSFTGLRIINDEVDKFRAAAIDALLIRGGIDIENPAQGADELLGIGFKNLTIECAKRDNIDTSISNFNSDDSIHELASRQFFNPTSSFPAILDNAMNKAYVHGHKNTQVTFHKWTTKGSVKDFHIHDNKYLLGSAGYFEEVPENGELKHDTIEDTKKPAVQLKTFGRQFTISRQAFINDDIGMLVQIPAKYAEAARKTINYQAYSVLINNSAIYDGTKLFSEVHNNVLNKGTGITSKAMQAMIQAIGTQADEFGNPCIIRPAYIIVPVGYSFEMYTLFNSPTINTPDNTQAVNPLYRYSGHIEIVEDPTINLLCGGYENIMPWFLVGNKQDTEFIEVTYLNGKEIPNIRRSEKSGTLGFIWDIYLDWGITVKDFRGAVKNPGVKISDPRNNIE